MVIILWYDIQVGRELRQPDLPHRLSGGGRQQVDRQQVGQVTPCAGNYLWRVQVGEVAESDVDRALPRGPGQTLPALLQQMTLSSLVIVNTQVAAGAAVDSRRHSGIT